MDLDQIQEILERYGLKQILLDHMLNELAVLEILDDNGYINLKEYMQDD